MLSFISLNNCVNYSGKLRLITVM